MNVNVYLKRSTGTTSPLVGQTSIDGTNVRFGLGINAPVAKWDRKRQRVRTGRDARLVDINAAIEREVQRVTHAFRKIGRRLWPHTPGPMNSKPPSKGSRRKANRAVDVQRIRGRLHRTRQDNDQRQR